MAAGVLGSATPEVGESEMSSSRLKSSAEAVRGSGLSSGGTEKTCVSELALASSPRDVSVATVEAAMPPASAKSGLLGSSWRPSAIAFCQTSPWPPDTEYNSLATVSKAEGLLCCA